MKSVCGVVGGVAAVAAAGGAVVGVAAVAVLLLLLCLTCVEGVGKNAKCYPINKRGGFSRGLLGGTSRDQCENECFFLGLEMNAKKKPL